MVFRSVSDASFLKRKLLADNAFCIFFDVYLID